MQDIVENKYNKYDYGIIFLIALLVFGNMGGAFEPIRVAGIILSPYLLAKFFKNRFTKEQMFVIKFFAFWFFYAVISLLWTNGEEQAYKELFYYYVHFSLFFIIVFFSQKAKRPLHSIIYGWCLFFILTAPIALNEIINDQHLPMSIFGADTIVNLGNNVLSKKKFASVTFGNYNGYVTVLTYILPFLFFSTLLKKNIKHQLFGMLLVSICLYIILVNASRGGILCLLITLIIFIFYYRKGSFRYKSGLIALVSILLFAALYYDSKSIFEQISHRSLSAASFAEDETRFNLSQLGLQLLSDTYFIGTGVGSMVSSLSAVSLGGILILHNLFLEIFMQYGLIIFGIFIVFLIKLFIRTTKIKSNNIKFLAYAILFSLVPSSVINSGYLLMPVFWILLASLFVIVTNKRVLVEK